MVLLSGCSGLELFDAMRQSESRDEQAATFDPGLANGTANRTEHRKHGTRLCCAERD